MFATLYGKRSCADKLKKNEAIQRTTVSWQCFVYEHDVGVRRIFTALPTSSCLHTRIHAKSQAACMFIPSTFALTPRCINDIRIAARVESKRSAHPGLFLPGTTRVTLSRSPPRAWRHKISNVPHGAACLPKCFNPRTLLVRSRIWNRCGISSFRN